MVPTIVPVAMEFHVTPSKATELFAYSVLSQGLSNIIWVPTMVKLGKRYAVILNCCLLLPCIIWGGCAKSYTSLLASRIVGGFASGASESYGPAIIGDIWYEHNLTTVIGVFTACVFISPTFGQIVIGYITQGVGWRWGYWVSLILAVLNAVGMFLTLPETTYIRGISVGVTAGDVQRQHDELDETNRDGLHSESTATAAPPFRLRDSLWYRKHPHVNNQDNYFITLVRPAIFMCVPNVLWAALLWACVTGAFVAIGVNVPILFSGPPYFFSPGAQGLFGLSSLIGVAIGGLAGGWVVDKVNAKIEKRRRAANKRHKPEERLILLVIPLFLAPVGLIMYGAFMQRQLPWIAAAFGYGISSAGMAMISSVILSYGVDAYIPRSGEIMVFFNCIRCLITFAFLKVMPHWTMTVGPLESYSTLAGIEGLFYLLAIPIFFFGPWFRQKTDRFL